MALPVIGARVIAYDPTLWSRSAIINQGKAQGVKDGLPVLAPQGIVGRIVGVYPEYSKVMLIVDRKSSADAMVQRTRVRGMLKGKGGNRCSLEFVPKNADVQVGDLVLASGLVGLYPKGLVFGKVTAANKKNPGVFQEIEVTPSVDLSTLEEVLVVKVATLALSRTMIAPLIAFSLVGLLIFYVQNLVFFPYVHLRLLALLLFYVGLRPSLSLTLALSLVLGCLQDSYATTPFGAPFGGVPGAGGHGPVFPAPPAPPAAGFPGVGQPGRPGFARGGLAARHLHAGLPAPFSPRPDQGARHGDPGHCGPGAPDASFGAGRGKLSAPSGLAAQK